MPPRSECTSGVDGVGLRITARRRTGASRVPKRELTVEVSRRRVGKQEHLEGRRLRTGQEGGDRPWGQEWRRGTGWKDKPGGWRGKGEGEQRGTTAGHSRGDTHPLSAVFRLQKQLVATLTRRHAAFLWPVS